MESDNCKNSSSNKMIEMDKKPLWSCEKILEWSKKYKTPFYMYDEKTIVARARDLHASFRKYFPNFRNFFAIKASPNPFLLEILKKEGMGVDCSSMAELLLAQKLNYKSEDIFFSSNNTPFDEFQKAIDMKCILNLDDYSLLPHIYQHFILPKKNIQNPDEKKTEEKKEEQDEEISLKKMKTDNIDDNTDDKSNETNTINDENNETNDEKRDEKKNENNDKYDLKYLSFRFNPGHEHFGGNDMIGKPYKAKFGLTREQIYDAFQYIQEKNIKIENMGIHTMVISNSIDTKELLYTGELMFDLCYSILQKYPSIDIKFINLGGGFGVPYRPEDSPLDLDLIAKHFYDKYQTYLQKEPKFKDIEIVTECGRYITAPTASLITRCINQKKIYKNYLGVDACMANLMRPALYGSYHHITVIPEPSPPSTLPANRNIFKNSPCKNDVPEGVYDVVGSLCENNDKFAIDRKLGEVNIGDVLVIHDAGAHGHAMGFNYNGKLRSAEYLLKTNGDVEKIRRAETYDDLFATLPNPCVHELGQPRDK